MKTFNQSKKTKSKTPDNGFSDKEVKFFNKRTEIIKMIETTLSVIVDHEDLNNNYNIVGKELLADAFMIYLEYELFRKEKKVVESMANLNTSFTSINEMINSIKEPKIDYIEYNKFMDLMEKYTNYNEFELLIKAKYETLSNDEIYSKLETLDYIINRNPKNEASNLIKKVLIENIKSVDN